MISIFGSGYGLLYPIIAAIGLPLTLAALFYAYLRRGRGNKKLIPSLLIIKKLSSAPKARKSFFPPLRFFIELVVLLLMIAAASGFFTETNVPRIAVLLDNSFSMSALDVSQSGSLNFLDIARKQAKTYVSTLNGKSQIDVLTTTPFLQLVGSEKTDSHSANQLIDKIEVAYGADSLSASLQDLATRGRYDKIAVFTDKEYQKEKDDTGVIKFENVRQNNNKLNNLAISGIKIRKESNKSVLDVGVQSYSSLETKANLSVELCSAPLDCKSLTEIAARELFIKPYDTLNEQFDLSQIVEGALRVKVKQARNMQTHAVDILARDDEMWYVSGFNKTKLLLVSDLTSNQLKLDSLKSFDIEAVNPEEYTTLVKELKLENYKAVIFHRVVPATLPYISSAFILPPSNDAIIKVGDEQKNVEITRWTEGSPLLDYTRLSKLSLPLFRPLSVPDWAEPLMYASGGVTLVAGDYKDKRYVFFGFELLPFEGSKSPTLSILLLNSIKWIAGDAHSSGVLHVGSKISFGVDSKEIRYLDGQQVANESTLPKPGVIVEQFNNGKAQMRAVQFFNAEESNVKEKNKVSISSLTLRNKNEAQEQYNYMLELSKFILALCVLDFLLRIIAGVRSKLTYVN